MTERSHYAARIETLANRARRDRERFELPASPPDERRALEYLREGFGPAVSVYVEGRTGGERVPFTDVEFSLLERSMNTWLSLYAGCYGRELDAEFSVREAAEVLVDTENVVDTARVLTRIPGRDAPDPRSSERDAT